MSASNSSSNSGPCGEPSHKHVNGGGTVSNRATVEATAYISADSAVCGSAMIGAGVQILQKSILTGALVIRGNSALSDVNMNANGSIENSLIEGTIISGTVQISESRVKDCIASGLLNLDSQTLVDQILSK